MKVERLTKVVHIVRFWDFITEAWNTISDKVEAGLSLEVVRKTLISLVVEHDSAWIGVVFDGSVPLAFGVVQECTPQFEPDRSFVVRWFYHSPQHFDASIALMTAFETWAKSQGIKRYAVTTRRSNGKAIRCFQSSKYGFGKAFLTFEKELWPIHH